MRINPYLVMDGTTREAIRFYEKALNAKVVGVVPFGEMPANPDFPLPEDAKERVAHALLKIGETDLMLSDTFPGQQSRAGDRVTICITTSSPERSREIYDALREGGSVEMPLQETFWSPAYGMVTDKFGIKLQISTEGQRQA